MTEPCDLTATEARRLIGERKLSPVDLLESCIKRVEAVNPAVNAIVTKAYDRARAEAKAAEAAVLNGEPLGLLHGLPCVIKDLNETEGIRTTYGSPLFKDNVPESDDPVVARLRRQGAVVFGKTNSPEFGVGSNTTNRLFGPTGNPFNPILTGGGSSGGAGVALATNMAPIANGSDSGASIRNPAAFNGVAGIRPTPGLVASERRAVGLSTNAVQGPMARNIADVALFLAAIAAEFDNRDMLSRPIDPTVFATLKHVDVSSLRVAVSEDLGFAPVDQVVRKIFRQKLSIFSSSFLSCDDYDVDMKNGETAYWGVRGLFFLAGSKKLYDEHRDELGPNLISNMEYALNSSSAEMGEALAEQTRIYRKFQDIFDTYDVLITPVANVLPFPHEQLYPTELDGRPARHYGEWFSICYGISLVGHPAVSIPCGLDSQGTPFGLQIVGPRFGDHRLLEISQALESLFATFPETCRPTPDIEALSKGPPLKQAIVVD